MDSTVRLPPICNSAIKKDERMADACAGTTKRENREQQGDKLGITGDTSMRVIMTFLLIQV